MLVRFGYTSIKPSFYGLRVCYSFLTTTVRSEEEEKELVIKCLI